MDNYINNMPEWLNNAAFTGGAGLFFSGSNTSLLYLQHFLFRYLHLNSKIHM